MLYKHCLQRHSESLKQLQVKPHSRLLLKVAQHCQCHNGQPTWLYPTQVEVMLTLPSFDCKLTQCAQHAPNQ